MPLFGQGYRNGPAYAAAGACDEVLHDVMVWAKGKSYFGWVHKKQRLLSIDFAVAKIMLLIINYIHIIINFKVIFSLKNGFFHELNGDCGDQELQIRRIENRPAAAMVGAFTP
jgi:hypothetical protein